MELMGIILFVILIIIFIGGLYKSIVVEREHFSIPILTLITLFGSYILLRTLAEKLNIRAEYFLSEPYLDENIQEHDTELTIVGFYIIFLSGMLSWRINRYLNKLIMDRNWYWEDRYKWNYIFWGVSISVLLIYPITVSDISIVLQFIYEILIAVLAYKYFSNRYKNKIKLEDERRRKIYSEQSNV